MGLFDVVDHVKEIAELADAYNHRDLYAKIVNLQSEVLKISEDNMKLSARVRELEQQQEIAAKIKREGNVYVGTPDNPRGDGPFCIPCWDGSQKLINLTIHREFPSGIKETECGLCKYRTFDQTPPPLPPDPNAGRPVAVHTPISDRWEQMGRR